MLFVKLSVQIAPAFVLNCNISLQWNIKVGKSVHFLFQIATAHLWAIGNIACILNYRPLYKYILGLSLLVGV